MPNRRGKPVNRLRHFMRSLFGMSTRQAARQYIADAEARQARRRLELDWMGSNAAAGDKDAERCLHEILLADLRAVYVGRIVSEYLRGERNPRG